MNIKPVVILVSLSACGNDPEQRQSVYFSRKNHLWKAMTSVCSSLSPDQITPDVSAPESMRMSGRITCTLTPEVQKGAAVEVVWRGNAGRYTLHDYEICSLTITPLAATTGADFSFVRALIRDETMASSIEAAITREGSHEVRGLKVVVAGAPNPSLRLDGCVK